MTVDPQALRDLAGFMVQAGRPVDADIVRAAADALDAARADLARESDRFTEHVRLSVLAQGDMMGELDEARAEVARLRAEITDAIAQKNTTTGSAHDGTLLVTADRAEKMDAILLAALVLGEGAE